MLRQLHAKRIYAPLPMTAMFWIMKRLLDAEALRALAWGCAILGAGGGCDARTGLLEALQAREEFGPVPLVDLDELHDDDLIMPCGMIGAPTVQIEKLQNGDEGGRLRDHLEALTGRKVAALMSAEIGGSNGLLPVMWAARIGLPVVDADGMGRAFPLIPQLSMELNGIAPTPCVMTDERGNVVEFRTISGSWLERLARAATIEFGGAASSTEYSMSVAQARTATVRGSVSLAIRIGQTLACAQDNPVAELIAELDAFCLVTGKVADVQRRTTEGFVRGSVIVEGQGPDAGRLLRLEIQNENLVVLEQGMVRASVPDLISVLDSQTARAIATEQVRYGQRVTVIAMRSHPVWRTKRGLQAAGPRAFGYEFDYVPIEELAGATV